MFNTYPKDWEALFEAPEKCSLHGLTLIPSRNVCQLCELADTTDIRVTIAKLGKTGLPKGLTVHQLETWSKGQILYHLQALVKDEASQRQRGRPRSTAKIDRTCPVCQQTFKIYPSQPKKFCSKPCYAKWRELP